MKSGLLAAFICVSTLALPFEAAAQQPVKIPALAPDVAVRPFFLFTEQRFTASETFDAIFEKGVMPFWGGGAQLAFSNGLFVEGTLSYFSREGNRAFVFEDESFPVGIPVQASIMPIEVTAGFRFGAEWSGRIIPYAGAGYGTYRYKESSDFEVDGSGDVNERGNGFLVVGGAEIRVHPWVVVSADAQYTHVGGILGKGGVSQLLGEDDLGGIAARFRIIIGR